MQRVVSPLKMESSSNAIRRSSQNGAMNACTKFYNNQRSTVRDIPLAVLLR